MNNPNLGSAKKEQSGAQLLSKLSCEVEGDASEVGVSEEVVQVVGEQLEDQAQVVLVHEVSLELH